MPTLLYCNYSNCRISSYQGEFFAPYQTCPGCGQLGGGAGGGTVTSPLGLTAVTFTYTTPARLMSYSRLSGTDEDLADEVGQVLNDLADDLHEVKLSYPASSDGWKLAGDIVSWLRGKAPKV